MYKVNLTGRALSRITCYVFFLALFMMFPLRGVNKLRSAESRVGSNDDKVADEHLASHAQY